MIEPMLLVDNQNELTGCFDNSLNGLMNQLTSADYETVLKAAKSIKHNVFGSDRKKAILINSNIFQALCTTLKRRKEFSEPSPYLNNELFHILTSLCKFDYSERYKLDSFTENGLQDIIVENLQNKLYQKQALVCFHSMSLNCLFNYNKLTQDEMVKLVEVLLSSTITDSLHLNYVLNIVSRIPLVHYFDANLIRLLVAEPILDFFINILLMHDNERIKMNILRILVKMTHIKIFPQALWSYILRDDFKFVLQKSKSDHTDNTVQVNDLKSHFLLQLFEDLHGGLRSNTVQFYAAKCITNIYHSLIDFIKADDPMYASFVGQLTQNQGQTKQISDNNSTTENEINDSNSNLNGLNGSELTINALILRRTIPTLVRTIKQELITLAHIHGKNLNVFVSTQTLSAGMNGVRGLLSNPNQAIYNEHYKLLIRAMYTLADLIDIHPDLQLMACYIHQLLTTLQELVQMKILDNGSSLGLDMDSPKGMLFRSALMELFGSLASNQEAIRKKLSEAPFNLIDILNKFTISTSVSPSVEVNDLMHPFVSSNKFCSSLARHNTYRCYLSLSRSIQLLRTSFMDSEIWKCLLNDIQSLYAQFQKVMNQVKSQNVTLTEELIQLGTLSCWYEYGIIHAIYNNETYKRDKRIDFLLPKKCNNLSSEKSNDETSKENNNADTNSHEGEALIFTLSYIVTRLNTCLSLLANLILDFSPAKEFLINQTETLDIICKIVMEHPILMTNSLTRSLLDNALWALMNVTFKSEKSLKLELLNRINFGEHLLPLLESSLAQFEDAKLDVDKNKVMMDTDLAPASHSTTNSVKAVFTTDESNSLAIKILGILRNVCGGGKSHLNIIIPILGVQSLINTLCHALSLPRVPTDYKEHVLCVMINLSLAGDISCNDLPFSSTLANNSNNTSTYKEANNEKGSTPSSSNNSNKQFLTRQNSNSGSNVNNNNNINPSSQMLNNCLQEMAKHIPIFYEANSKQNFGNRPNVPPPNLGHPPMSREAFLKTFGERLLLGAGGPPPPPSLVNLLDEHQQMVANCSLPIEGLAYSVMNAAAAAAVMQGGGLNLSNPNSNANLPFLIPALAALQNEVANSGNPPSLINPNLMNQQLNYPSPQFSNQWDALLSKLCNLDFSNIRLPNAGLLDPILNQPPCIPMDFVNTNTSAKDTSSNKTLVEINDQSQDSLSSTCAPTSEKSESFPALFNSMSEQLSGCTTLSPTVIIRNYLSSKLRYNLALREDVLKCLIDCVLSVDTLPFNSNWKTDNKTIESPGDQPSTSGHTPNDADKKTATETLLVDEETVDEPPLVEEIGENSSQGDSNESQTPKVSMEPISEGLLPSTMNTPFSSNPVSLKASTDELMSEIAQDKDTVSETTVTTNITCAHISPFKGSVSYTVALLASKVAEEKGERKTTKDAHLDIPLEKGENKSPGETNDVFTFSLTTLQRAALRCLNCIYNSRNTAKIDSVMSYLPFPLNTLVRDANDSQNSGSYRISTKSFYWRILYNVLKSYRSLTSDYSMYSTTVLPNQLPLSTASNASLAPPFIYSINLMMPPTSTPISADTNTDSYAQTSTSVSKNQKFLALKAFIKLLKRQTNLLYFTSMGQSVDRSTENASNPLIMQQDDRTNNDFLTSTTSLPIQRFTEAMQNLNASDILLDINRENVKNVIPAFVNWLKDESRANKKRGNNNPNNNNSENVVMRSNTNSNDTYTNTSI